MEELQTKDWKAYLTLRSQLTGYPLKLSKRDFFDKYRQIKEQGSIIYVYKIEDNLIATGKLLIEVKFGDNVAHIEDVVVDENFRRKGYGRQIISKLIEHAKGKCYKIILVTKDHNEVFYKKSGLKTSGIFMCKMLD